MRANRMAGTMCMIALLGGCAGAVEDGLSRDGAGTLLELEIDGVNLEFIEVEPGLLMVTSEPVDRTRNPLARADLRGLNVVQLYERLAGSEAPSVLLDAYERSQMLGLDVAEVRDAVDGAGQALTAAEFANTECDGRALCFVDQTANREWGEYRVHQADGAVDAVSGTVAVQIRHRRVRDWSNDQYHQVPEGTMKPWIYFSPRPLVQFRLKVAVYEVDPGDMYHFAMEWD